ncbi:MAG TPA: phosphatase PAP2 family protein [Vicinamibacterales bacterium]|nr:phosphatase PAP2 family protein [Vicinamibacterales bacterium]
MVRSKAMIPSAGEARSVPRRGSWRRVRAVLRPEDALFLLALVPSTIVTIWANVALSNAGVDSRRIRGGLLRLGVAALLAVAVPLLVRALRRTRHALQAAEFLYTILPFLLCIAVYTNLHDTIRFINPHDIDPYLAGAEAWVFGGQPVVWAQQFITPFRTDLFSLFYTSFVLIAPSVVLILWFSGRRAEAREVLLATIVCFYSGYVLYVIFPATPPRLYLAAHGYFTTPLHGGALTNMQQAMIEMMPRHASRAAFPSLHSAVSCLSLYYAWRYCRWFFPILLVLVVGLLTSTVYLRHHYVLDLVAGAMLVPWAVWASGRLDRWWTR